MMLVDSLRCWLPNSILNFVYDSNIVEIRVAIRKWCWNSFNNKNLNNTKYRHMYNKIFIELTFRG